MIVPCVACGAELDLRQRTQPHCLSDECNLGYAMHMARTNVEQEGDCAVWKGTYSHNGNARTPVVRVVVDRKTSKRVDYRVLPLREPDPSLATKRNYTNLCGTFGCVEIAHHNLQVSTTVHRVLQGKLPAEPLLDALNGRPMPTKRLRELVRIARQRGWVRVLAVDEICIDVLGIHPANLYGEEFFTA